MKAVGDKNARRQTQRQAKRIGKNGELHWELRLSTENNSAAIACWNALKHKLSFLDRLQ